MNKPSFYQKVFRTFGIVAMALGLVCCTTGCLEYMVYKTYFTPGGTVNEQEKLEKAFASNDDEKMEAAANKYLAALPRKSAADLLDKFCGYGNLKVAVLLLNHHVEPSRSALYFAATSGSVDICKRLLEVGCDINEVDRKTGRAGLFGAIHNGKPQIFDYFMQAGAHTDIKDLDDSNPFMYAASVGNQHAFQSLINAPSLNLDDQDKLGNTALMYCALMNNTNCLAAALDRHAKSDIANKDELTALQLAISTYSYEAAFILISKDPAAIRSSWDPTTAEEKYVSSVANLIQAEVAGDMTRKASALSAITSARDACSFEANEAQHKISVEKTKYAVLKTLDVLSEIASSASSSYSSTTTLKYSTPSGVYTQTFKTTYIRNTTINPGFADDAEHEKIIRNLTHRLFSLKRQTAMCSEILKKATAAIPPDERKNILETANKP